MVPVTSGGGGAVYSSRRLWNKVRGCGASNTQCWNRSIVWFSMSRSFDCVDNARADGSTAPSRGGAILRTNWDWGIHLRVPAVEEKHGAVLFTGHRSICDGAGFLSRRYQEELSEARGKDDASPQTRFCRKSCSIVRECNTRVWYCDEPRGPGRWNDETTQCARRKASRRYLRWRAVLLSTSTWKR